MTSESDLWANSIGTLISHVLYVLSLTEEAHELPGFELNDREMCGLSQILLNQ